MVVFRDAYCQTRQYCLSSRNAEPFVWLKKSKYIKQRNNTWIMKEFDKNYIDQLNVRIWQMETIYIYDTIFA